MDVIAEYKYKSIEDKQEKMKDLMKEITQIMKEDKYNRIDIEKLYKITDLSFGDLQHFSRSLGYENVFGKLMVLNRTSIINEQASVEDFKKQNYFVNDRSLTDEDCIIINEYLDEYNLKKIYGVVKSVVHRYLTTGDVYTDGDDKDQVQYLGDRIVFLSHQKEINAEKHKK